MNLVNRFGHNGLGLSLISMRKPCDAYDVFFYVSCLVSVSVILPPYVKTEPRREKTGLRGFRPGPTKTDLYSHRNGLEA